MVVVVVVVVMVVVVNKGFNLNVGRHVFEGRLNGTGFGSGDPGIQGKGLAGDGELGGRRVNFVFFFGTRV